MTLEEFLDEWHRQANEYGASLTQDQRDIAEQDSRQKQARIERLEKALKELREVTANALNYASAPGRVMLKTALRNTEDI